jgi:hypothetical protein
VISNTGSDTKNLIDNSLLLIGLLGYLEGELKKLKDDEMQIRVILDEYDKLVRKRTFGVNIEKKSEALQGLGRMF